MSYNNKTVGPHHLIHHKLWEQLKYERDLLKEENKKLREALEFLMDRRCEESFRNAQEALGGK